MSSKNKIWFGYLDAGDKSTLVAMDPKLDTANPKTVYLFNLKRGQILEYQREIVEPKLRELKSKEEKSMDEIAKAFTKVKKDFTPRRTATKLLAETPNVGASSNKKNAAKNTTDSDTDTGDDIDIDMDDIDIDDDDSVDVNDDS